MKLYVEPSVELLYLGREDILTISVIRQIRILEICSQRRMVGIPAMELHPACFDFPSAFCRKFVTSIIHHHGRMIFYRIADCIY